MPTVHQDAFPCLQRSTIPACAPAVQVGIDCGSQSNFFFGDVVENELQRPRLKQIRGAFATSPWIITTRIRLAN
jgi:hypothetical protein